jgi:asparagine synthetase B (glutamine-hydrolysing)
MMRHVSIDPSNNICIAALTCICSEAIAKRTAEFLGLPFVSTRLDEAAFAENFEQTYLHSEHHNPDLNSVAKFVLSGLARENGVKVILSGIVAPLSKEDLARVY